MKRITLGGEKSENKLYAELTQIFPNAKINNIYASTEIGTLLFSSNDEFGVIEKFQNDVCIIENELCVKEYLVGKSSELTFENGWYHTGDLVEIISKTPLKFKFSQEND